MSQILTSTDLLNFYDELDKCNCEQMLFKLREHLSFIKTGKFRSDIEHDDKHKIYLKLIRSARASPEIKNIMKDITFWYLNWNMLYTYYCNICHGDIPNDPNNGIRKTYDAGSMQYHEEHIISHIRVCHSHNLKFKHDIFGHKYFDGDIHQYYTDLSTVFRIK